MWGGGGGGGGSTSHCSTLRRSVSSVCARVCLFVEKEKKKADGGSRGGLLNRVNLHAVAQGCSLNGLAEGLPHPIHSDTHSQT